MPIFRKKPIVVLAHIWDEKRSTLDRIGCNAMSCRGNIDRPDECTHLFIETRKGILRINAGEYIIKGIAGDFYSCKPDIFRATYEYIGCPHDK